MSSSSSKAAASNHHVTDYFCILGVGEELVWKHKQKQQQQQQQQQQEEGSDCGGEATSVAAIRQKEEERFQREIVNVKIVCVNESSETQSKQQQQQQQQPPPSKGGGGVLPGGGGASGSGSMVPSSPSQQSEATTTTTSTAILATATTTTTTTSGPIVTRRRTTRTNNSKEEEENDDNDDDGWTVLRHTLPPKVWDANLDWATGLYAQVNNRNDPQQTNSTQQQQQQQPSSSSSLLQLKLNLSSSSSSRLKNHTADANANDASYHHHDHQHGNKSSSSSTRTKFYLAYRRRGGRQRESRRKRRQSPSSSSSSSSSTGSRHPPTITPNEHQQQQEVDDHGLAWEDPNEDDHDYHCYRPAISQIDLRYVRIHRECLPEQHEPQQHSKQQQQPAPQTTMGFLAEQLKRYHSSGFHQHHQSSLSHDQDEESYSNYSDRQQQPQLDHENEQLLVPLEHYLLLPEGYEEWSIPAEFRYIRDPQTVYKNAMKKKNTATTATTTTTVIDDHLDHDPENGGDSGGGFEATMIETVSSCDMGGGGGRGDTTATTTATATTTGSLVEDEQQGNHYYNYNNNSRQQFPQHQHPYQPLPPQQQHNLSSSCGATGSTSSLLPRLMKIRSTAFTAATQPTTTGTTSNSNSAEHNNNNDSDYLYVPVLAIRRQAVDDEERFHEDAAIVDLTVSYYYCHNNYSGNDHPSGTATARSGGPVMPSLDDEDETAEEEQENGNHCVSPLLGKTEWACANHNNSNKSITTLLSSGGGGGNMAAGNQSLGSTTTASPLLGSPVLLSRRNRPFGFADAAFCTSVLHRFPFQNYQDLPLPEEELPMFCYPTGCRLHRARFSEAPLAEYYGFVVKNERGDSIFVSCVSFMEPLTHDKVRQLDRMSQQRREFSLPHRKFCQEQERRRKVKKKHLLWHQQDGAASDVSTAVDSSFLMGFDDMTTFETKTICLVSRYPFWTAFRKFLSHLHILSTSTSDLPLERYVSHLLLVVPVPKPGGPSVIVPLPALSSNDPMVLTMPPEKDFPLVDIPYQRLVACLDVKSIATIVLSLLALERKVIVMSTRPSLVLDVCELLRSLIFPFDLCAPYVPRLTEPFQSSLDFPGALFVGIHKDGSPSGLAEMVIHNPPEDSILVDLDTGAMDCDGDRYEVLSKNAWELLPAVARTVLISELETLCRDAGIVDGQEPLDSQYDSAFDVSLTAAVVDCGVSCKSREPLDDRAFRDAFLRFFCSVLGGYDRFLVVPDADFLVSGNEWFDAQGFLASVPSERAPYLGTLVSTQLFQSFIQKRTEASDVHCLLFDECITEFHSASVPYGRLGDVETVPSVDHHSSQPQLIYSLLVDQSATLQHSSVDQMAIGMNRSMDASEADSSLNLSKTSFSVADYSVKYGESTVNINGDFVTGPSHQDLPIGKRYMYCVDGNPCFPQRFNPALFLPKEPESWFIEMTKAPNPLLFRSDQELEDANRRRRKATSYRGLQTQRRCMWQLPKLMGSHVLGAWLLCIPVQVSQKHLTHEQQTRYLMLSLGALRLLRSRQRIVPDEAAYRALMAACGRARSDRRVELVKLFGLLRSDGIFPSAVTLGQYTRALAEGYSKRLSETTQEDDFGFEVTESTSRIGRLNIVSMSRRQGRELESTLWSLDSNISALEYHGRRWRHRNGLLPGESKVDQKKNLNKAWLPVVYSTSFVPYNKDCCDDVDDTPPAESIRLVAMWSRTRGCRNCSYIPLDEEIQAGWDVIGGDHDIPGAVACPRCGSLVLPMLGYREMTLAQAFATEENNASFANDAAATTSAGAPAGGGAADFGSLPPQTRPYVDTTTNDASDVSYVTYISPATLRRCLEQYVEEYGEDVLDRDRLRERDAEVFFNFLWYCARFSLPLPLPISVASSASSSCDNEGKKPYHYCAFAAWDRCAAERGCLSAAKVLAPIVDWIQYPDHHHADEEIHLDVFEDQPLLSRYNLQGFHSTVWDHVDLSAILVKLVEACDKRDFKPVVEAALNCNNRRRQQYYTEGTNDDDEAGSEVNSAALAAAHRHPLLIGGGGGGGGGVGSQLSTSSSTLSSSASSSVELDIYRTTLYLAKYQCTTAFHAFFPATAKPCKGSHFWCAIGTPLPMFDRLFRDAVERIKKDQNNNNHHHHSHAYHHHHHSHFHHHGGAGGLSSSYSSSSLPMTPIPEISEVALGFRCVFGHLI